MPEAAEPTGSASEVSIGARSSVVPRPPQGKVTVQDLRKRLDAVQDIEQQWEVIQRAMLDAEEALRPSNVHQLLTAVNCLRLADPQSWDNYVGSREWKLQMRVRGTVTWQRERILDGIGIW